jgi:hypothetical protein
MKAKDVVVGRVYVVKVSGKLASVRIDASRERVVRQPSRKGTTILFSRPIVSGGGYIGTNIRTNREVNIRSAARLRYEVMKCDLCGDYTRDLERRKAFFGATHGMKEVTR